MNGMHATSEGAARTRLFGTILTMAKQRDFGSPLASKRTVCLMVSYAPPVLTLLLPEQPILNGAVFGAGVGTLGCCGSRGRWSGEGGWR